MSGVLCWQSNATDWRQFTSAHYAI